MTMTPTTDAHRELEKAIELLKQVQIALPKEVKTVSKHDFTGYQTDVIVDSLRALNGLGSLPGPLSIVRRALEASYKMKTGCVYVEAPMTGKVISRPLADRYAPKESLGKSGALLRAIANRHRDPNDNPITGQ